MSVMSAFAGGSLGYADGEVGVGGVAVGGLMVDAAGEGGARDGSADAVGVRCAVVVSVLVVLVTLMVMLVSVLLRVLASFATPMPRALLVVCRRLVSVVVLQW